MNVVKWCMSGAKNLKFIGIKFHNCTCKYIFNVLTVEGV